MLLVLTSIGVVWTITLVTSYRQALHEVAEWENARLEEAARTLLAIDETDLGVLAKGGFVGSDDNGDDSKQRLLFEVRGTGDRVLARSPGLTNADLREATTPSLLAGAWSVAAGGANWHVYMRRDAASGRVVRVYERSESRSDLASDVARRVARPIAYGLPVLALLVWLSIGRSLAPLASLSAAIRSRNADNLDSIDLHRTPSEVRSLLDALNNLLDRLRRSFERERAFTADAAHELKSPLAAIKVQAQVALMAQEASVQRLAMQRVVEGVDRSTRLADQLLLLARIDETKAVPIGQLRLDTVVDCCVRARQVDAADKKMTLTSCLDGDATVVADPELLSILVDNLLDNAVKYGREGGRIEVVVRRFTRDTRLVVRDDGQGVAAEDRARLTDRFFRVVGNGSPGSGLGLSIVARIAALFGARLTFEVGIEGHGLGVAIDFKDQTDFPCLINQARHNTPATMQ